MKVNAYVNWNTREICSECELSKKINSLVEEYMEGEPFNYFLNCNFTAIEIFDLTDEEKERIEKEARITFLEEITDDIGRNWNRVIIEL